MLLLRLNFATLRRCLDLLWLTTCEFVQCHWRLHEFAIFQLWNQSFFLCTKCVVGRFIACEKIDMRPVRKSQQFLSFGRIYAFCWEINVRRWRFWVWVCLARLCLVGSIRSKYLGRLFGRVQGSSGRWRRGSSTPAPPQGSPTGCKTSCSPPPSTGWSSWTCRRTGRGSRPARSTSCWIWPPREPPLSSIALPLAPWFPRWPGAGGSPLRLAPSSPRASWPWPGGWLRRWRRASTSSSPPRCCWPPPPRSSSCWSWRFGEPASWPALS